MSAPYFTADGVAVYLGDCLEVLRTLPDASVDAVVCDPPYALAELSTTLVLDAIAAWMRGERDYVPAGKGGFMGREWDRFVPPPGAWDECLRVLKPGGHLLAFAAPRTADLMGLSIRIAGFEIRDSIDWIGGQGFPKGIDVGKAIDKAAGAVRAEIGERVYAGGHIQRSNGTDLGTLNDDGWKPTDGRAVTAPATGEAARWEGWNTSLKPAHEPIAVARRPLAGTVAANVLQHGTGALNIDATRTAAGQDYRDKCASVVGLDSNRNGDAYGEWAGARTDSAHQAGRWPTNVVMTHQPLIVDGEIVGDACADGCVDGCPVAELDQQSGMRRGGGAVRGDEPSTPFSNTYGEMNGRRPSPARADYGGASRFFPTFRYEAKAAAHERPRLADGTTWPTVKPLGLMRWLIRLVTPPGGTVLDPFAGSGATGEAAVIEGFNALLVERDPLAAELIKARLGKPISPVLDFGEEIA